MDKDTGILLVVAMLNILDHYYLLSLLYVGMEAVCIQSHKES